MLEQLKEEVLKANLELVTQGLVKYTWGNVSGFDPEKKLVVIKPSGVDYATLKAEDLVVLDLDGNIVEGSLRPSSDTPTHLVLYKHFPNIRGITHTHSQWATAFAQAGLGARPLGTTHADTFYGEVPCARLLTKNEIDLGYEEQTGNVIIETFLDKDYEHIPGVLLSGHGPFTWGKTPNDAVLNAVVLDEVCKMNYYTLSLQPEVPNLNHAVLDKHFLRKHGKDAYYGQK